MYIKVVLICMLFAPVVKRDLSFPEDLKKVGQAELQVLWFDIYEARLLNPEGIYSGSGGKMMLTLDYKRRISVEDLLDETEFQIKRFARPSDIRGWLSQLEAFWVTVKKGDQLAFYIDAQGGGHFFFNQKWIGVINEPDFSQAFINIWLSDQSSYPRLAKRLRGELNNEKIN